MVQKRPQIEIFAAFLFILEQISGLAYLVFRLVLIACKDMKSRLQNYNYGGLRYLEKAYTLFRSNK